MPSRDLFQEQTPEYKDVVLHRIDQAFTAAAPSKGLLSRFEPQPGRVPVAKPRIARHSSVKAVEQAAE